MCVGWNQTPFLSGEIIPSGFHVWSWQSTLPTCYMPPRDYTWKGETFFIRIDHREGSFGISLIHWITAGKRNRKQQKVVNSHITGLSYWSKRLQVSCQANFWCGKSKKKREKKERLRVREQRGTPQIELGQSCARSGNCPFLQGLHEGERLSPLRIFSSSPLAYACPSLPSLGFWVIPSHAFSGLSCLANI